MDELDTVVMVVVAVVVVTVLFLLLTAVYIYIYIYTVGLYFQNCYNIVVELAFSITTSEYSSQ